MRNFGFDGPEAFAELGVNAKNSEFYAAMGLANLQHIDYIKKARKLISECYDEKLKSLKARSPVWSLQSENNYAYYPVIFESEKLMLKCMEHLKLHEIYTRRYFYSSLAKVLPYITRQNLAITDDIASRVLCLPLYHDLAFEEVDMISRLLLRIQNN